MKKNISRFRKHFDENKHHYFFSLFGVFAVVKTILLIAWLLGNISFFHYHTSAAYETFCIDNSWSLNVPVIECEALVALYNDTNWPWRTTGTNRLNSGNVCNRYGITCFNNHVQEISLPWNSLSGIIPTEIGNMDPTGFRSLNLSNNHLIWDIPAEIGNLTNLESLYLRNNQLTSLPTEIGNLTHMNQIRIQHNELTSLPTEIGNLINLEFLYLDNNHLTSLPESLTGTALWGDVDTFTIDYNEICTWTMSPWFLSYVNTIAGGATRQTRQDCHTSLQCASTNHVVIAKVRMYTTTEEYVVLYNPTSSSILLSWWKLDTSSSANDATIPAWTTIQPHGFFSFGDTGDYVETITIADSIWAVDIKDSSWQLVDALAWGNYVSGNATGEWARFTPGANSLSRALERKAFAQSTANSMMSGGSDYYNGNSYDSNNNATDFVRVLPEIQWANSITETCSETLPNIIITEFMYNPNPLDPNKYERVEIYNAGNLPINVDGRKRDSNPFSCTKDTISWRSWSTTIIPAKWYAIVTEQWGYAYISWFTLDPNVIKLKVDDDAIWCFGLNDANNEKHRLSLADGTTLITSGTYSKNRWADGSGKSLQLVNYFSWRNQFNVCGSLPTMGTGNSCIPPVLTEIMPVTTPTNDTTPNYVFYADEAVTITYGGNCNNTPWVSIFAWVYTATLAVLPDGVHTNCTVIATDAAGNNSVPLIIPAFTIDATPPTILLSGNANITIIINTNYTDDGATAYDIQDGDLTNNIVTSGIIDTGTLWSYIITYNVSDSLGNQAIEAMRTVNVVVQTPPTWGGWWWTVTHKDDCPDGDYSPSYYDNICGKKPINVSWSVSGAAHAAPTTTTYEKAITRKVLAKLTVMFVQEMLSLEPDTHKACDFTDIKKQTIEDQSFIKASCQLGLMGLHKDGTTPKKTFEPNKIVGINEFSTVFSRLLYGGKNNVALTSSIKRYTNHIKALQIAKIFQDIPKKIVPSFVIDSLKTIQEHPEMIQR